MLPGNTPRFSNRRGALYVWIAVVIALLAALVLAVVLLWPRYRAWRSAKALAEARQAYVLGEYRRQQLHLEQSLQMDPGNMEARRELAGFYDHADPVRAQELWAGLCVAEPMEIRNHEGLVLNLVRSGQLASAARSLASIPEPLQGGAAYHRLAGVLAYAEGRLDALQHELDALAGIGVVDTSLAFSRAVLRMYAAKGEAETSAATEAVVSFARQDGFRIRGCIALLKVRPVGVAWEAWASRVAGLVLAGGAGGRGLPALIDFMALQPKPAAEDAAEFMIWLSSSGLARDAIAWFRTQPVALQESLVVTEALATCLVQVSDWQGLRSLLEKGIWGGIGSDALELAYAARQQREMSKLNNAKATWQDALDAAERHPGGFRVLARLALEWGWPEERELALRALVRALPQDFQAWGSLFQMKCAQGDTAAAWSILGDWQKRQPSSQSLLADQLLFGALVDRLTGPQQERVLEMAQASDASVSVLAAAAYLNLRQGHIELAGRMLDSLSKRRQAGVLTPRGRLALACVHRALGQAAKARELLENLPQDALFPEEKALIYSNK